MHHTYGKGGVFRSTRDSQRGVDVEVVAAECRARCSAGAGAAAAHAHHASAHVAHRALITHLLRQMVCEVYSVHEYRQYTH